MRYKVRKFHKEDLEIVLPIWNEVIEDGCSMPFEEFFTKETLSLFLESFLYLAVVVNEEDIPIGMYTLNPNYPGRCNSIANCSYLVKREFRGKHLGEILVFDSLDQAKKFGFRLMQFNGVVHSNIHARHLYQRCGFKELGIIPKGFRIKDGSYEDMHIFYKQL